MGTGQSISTKCNPVPPLEAMPGYKRLSIQTQCLPLLGDLTKFTLRDSKKFLLQKNFPEHQNKNKPKQKKTSLST